MKKSFKNKICALLLLGLAFGIFCGCDSDKSEKESDAPETIGNAETADTPETTDNTEAAFDFSDFAWTGETIRLPFVPFDTDEGESSHE